MRTEVDPKCIMAIRVPKGVNMYPIPLLVQALDFERQGLERMPLLDKSG